MSLKSKKFWKICKLVFIFSFILIFSGLLVAYLVLKGSSPRLAGKLQVSGIHDIIHIERDQQGIATIRGQSRQDVAYATGFIHSQERFFQMDLLRRMASGELSELFGSSTLEFDKSRRMHGFRKQANILWLKLTSDEKEIISAYTKGVNAGLKALRFKPFEYFILREQPVEWKEEDSLLVGLGLFFDLQDSLGKTNWTRGVLKTQLPLPVYEFFTQNGSRWDAPLDHSVLEMLPIPDCKYFEYIQKNNQCALSVSNQINLPPMRGSNQWAIHSSLTENGKAILACDLHLDLFAPNIWYRLAIDYKSKEGKDIVVSGVSLPGTPLITMGSNSQIAWGFTDTYIDSTDLVMLDIDPYNSNAYLCQQGSKPFEEKVEEIKIKGKTSINQTYLWTQWGPVHPWKWEGKYLAIRWIAHDLDAFNFQLFELEKAQNAFETLELMPKIRIPALNFVVADHQGNIGWSIVGAIPKREGYQPGLPVSFTDGGKKWTGTRDKKEYPIYLNPKQGYLWTANNRVLKDIDLGHNYLNSIRAYQIKYRLCNLNKSNILDSYQIQLDDKAIFFERWNQILCDSFNLNNFQHQQLYNLVKNWNGHCSAASQEYFWIRNFRERVMQKILQRVLRPCFEAYPDLDLSMMDLEEPIYLIASQQPFYLKDPQLNSWKEEFEKIIDEMLDEYKIAFIQKKEWGQFNKVRIQHPLSRALSCMKVVLDMPQKPLAGDYFVPRLSGPSVGASVRMVVSPGDEPSGILSMPCGQSGHPLQPQYRDQQQDWVSGTVTPFLAGPSQHNFYLLPQ